MKVTYTTKQNTKGEVKYIYSYNGQVVRTSSHLYEYCYIENGETKTFGKFSTCAGANSVTDGLIRHYTAYIEYLEGKINFNDLLKRGLISLMPVRGTRKRYRESGEIDKEIEEQKEWLKILKNRERDIVKIEAE